MENSDFSKIAAKIHKDNYSRYHEEKDQENAKRIRDCFGVLDYEHLIAEITNTLYDDDLKRKILKEYSKYKDNSIKELKKIKQELSDKIDNLIKQDKRNVKKARALIWASVSMAIITTL